jgi:hypothetical protein
MAFKSVSCNFLGDKKTQVYEELLQDMSSLYLSVLIWFISKEINHQVSGRYEESFHYDIALLERRCKGKCRETTYIYIIADFCLPVCHHQKITKRKNKQITLFFNEQL